MNRVVVDHHPRSSRLVAGLRECDMASPQHSQHEQRKRVTRSYFLDSESDVHVFGSVVWTSIAPFKHRYDRNPETGIA